MKPHRVLMLAAIVLACSACASNTVKPSGASASEVRSAPVAAVAAQSAPSSPLELEVLPPRESVGSTEVVDEALANDPWEGYNRRMYAVNNVFDKYVARPVATAYAKVTPEPVKSSVTRFFKNLGEPATAVNQVLQGRPANSVQSLGRFVVNTTVGLGGLFDPATSFGMPKQDDEDFGQTLATWGWRDSRYFVMPLLGPRTLRDTVSLVGDQPLSPISYVGDTGVAYTLRAVQLVDGRARALPMDDARKYALDEYIMVRDAWMLRRNRQIEQDLRSNRD